MPISYSKDAIKIGFSDISFKTNNNDVFLNDAKMSINDQKTLLYSLSNRERCYDDVIFVNETRYNNEVPNPENSTSNSVETISLPTNQELTTPPKTKDTTLSDAMPYIVGGIGAFFLIKLLS